MKDLPLYHNHYIKLHLHFEKAVIAQGYSRGKDCNYPSMIKEFLFFLENKDIEDIKAVKAKDIIAYYEYLRERPNQRREGGISDALIRQHLYALRLFFDYLLKIKEIENYPARLPKFIFEAYEDRQIINQEEIWLLYNHTRNSIERAILGIAYGCGLRRTEMERLNIKDIIFHQCILIVRKGKGNKSRTVPIVEEVIKDLKEYYIYERSKRIVHGDPTCKSFFINRWGERMQGQTFNYKLKKLVERTGNKALIAKDISLHNLRHSITTHLMDNGADIEFVRRFLGHTLLDTTVLYSKRRKQQLKNTIN